LGSKLKSLEDNMSKALSRASTVLQASMFSEDATKQLKALKNQWSLLTHNKLKSMGAGESFAKHGEWVIKVNRLVDTVATESGLILDPHMDTYLLMQLTAFDIPALQELLGQLRGRGAGVATKGSFDSSSFISVSNLYNDIDLIQGKIEHKFKEIGKNYPSHVLTVKSELAQAIQSAKAFKDVTKSKLLDPDTPTIGGEEYFSVGSLAISHLSKLHEKNNHVFQETLEQYASKGLNELILILGVFSILFISGIYLFLCLKNAVDSNLGITLNMAADLDKGVLNGEYHSKSNDELGHTVGALNNAYAQLRKVVQQVRDNSVSLSSSSKDLQGVSKEVNELGEEQKSRVGVIVTAATELAATAKEVAAHCDTAASETKSAQQLANQGAERSQASASVIRELAQSIRKAGEEIGQLAQQAASISTVIDVIKAIAEQTNLLALNAAIEAARAGEQGRGFAVVADEVRTLANRTQESTNEIESTIASLQQVAEQAVSAMDVACEQATTGESESIQTGEMLGEIEKSVDQVNNLINQVATAGEQQAGAADEIAQHIHAVDDASTNLVEKALGVANIAGDVGAGSSQLEDTVQQFKL
jgi:methyl-accepting chemotaxis protein